MGGGSGGVGSAKEQMRGQHVEWLELTADVAEDSLQILQNSSRELVNEKGAAWLQRAAGLSQDTFAHRRGNGAEGDARDYVVRLFVAELAQDLVDRLCGGFYHVKALIMSRRAQEAHERRVDFHGNEGRVRAHAPKDLHRNAANAGAVFHDHTRLRPVDRLKQLLDQKPRARNYRAEHPRMTKKVAREKQGVPASRSVQDFLLVRQGMPRPSGIVSTP
jgi:hypothetical protein